MSDNKKKPTSIEVEPDIIKSAEIARKVFDLDEPGEPGEQVEDK